MVPQEDKIRGPKLPLILGLLAIFGLVAVPVLLVLQMVPRGERGQVYQVRDFKGPKCDVRVTAYKEKTSGFALPGAYFRFEAIPLGGGVVRNLFECRQDDPAPIPEGCVRFSGPDHISAFMGRWWASSADGGKSWVVTDEPGGR